MTQPRFNGVDLTPETVQTTRQWFHDNALACVEEIRTGKAKVDAPQAAIEWYEGLARHNLTGRFDHSLTFLQRAHFIQTGVDVALLP